MDYNPNPAQMPLRPRGGEKASFAKMSVGIAVFSLVFGASILAFSIWTVFTIPAERERFNQTYEQMYGITFDEALEEFQQSIQ